MEDTPRVAAESSLLPGGPTGWGGVSRVIWATCQLRSGTPCSHSLLPLISSRSLRQVSPGRQTLSWRFTGRFPENRNRGGVKEAGLDRVRSWALMQVQQRPRPLPHPTPGELPTKDGPAGSSPPAPAPPGGKEDLPLSCAFTSHWTQTASRKWGTLEEGGSLQPSTLRSKRGSPWSCQLPTFPTAGRADT